jgi:hypothetical protein
VASVISGIGAAICTVVIVVRYDRGLVLAYFGSQCMKFRAAGWTFWFFTSFYLESWYLVWCNVAMHPTKEQLQILFKSKKKCDGETLAMIRQAFGQESMSCTWVFKWHARFRVKSSQRKVKSMLIILTSRGLLTKNLSFQAKQSISHNTVMLCSDCMKMC